MISRIYCVLCFILSTFANDDVRDCDKNFHSRCDSIVKFGTDSPVQSVLLEAKWANLQSGWIGFTLGDPSKWKATTYIGCDLSQSHHTAYLYNASTATLNRNSNIKLNISEGKFCNFSSEHYNEVIDWTFNKSQTIIIIVGNVNETGDLVIDKILKIDPQTQNQTTTTTTTITTTTEPSTPSHSTAAPASATTTRITATTSSAKSSTIHDTNTQTQTKSSTSPQKTTTSPTTATTALRITTTTSLSAKETTSRPRTTTTSRPKTTTASLSAKETTSDPTTAATSVQTTTATPNPTTTKTPESPTTTKATFTTTTAAKVRPPRSTKQANPTTQTPKSSTTAEVEKWLTETVTPEDYDNMEDMTTGAGNVTGEPSGSHTVAHFATWLQFIPVFVGVKMLMWTY